MFESTCTWRESLTVPSSGSAGNPITFGAYGTGAAPVIDGANVITGWSSSAQGNFTADAAMQAYWYMEESSSPRTDGTGNGNSLANVYGTVTQNSDHVQGSYSVQIASGGIRCANASLSAAFPVKAATTAYTFGGWYKITSYGSYMAALVFSDTSSKGVYAKVNPSMQFYWNHYLVGGSDVVTTASDSQSTLALNTWAFITVTWDGTTVKVYVNGRQDSHTGSAASIALEGTDPFGLENGAGTSLWDMWFAMSRALSAGEVSAIYANQLAGFTVYEAALAAQPHQAFRDGTLLLPVGSTSALSPGTWYWDGADLWVYDNPTGHTIEAGQRGNIVHLNGKNYITINGIQSDKSDGWNGNFMLEGGSGHVILNGVTASNGSNEGVWLNGDAGSDVLVENCQLYNNGGGFLTANLYAATAGHEAVLQNCSIHNNENQAVILDGAYAIIQYDYIWNNSYPNYPITADAVAVHIYETTQSFPTTSAKNNIIRWNVITGQGGNEQDNEGIETDGYTSANQIYGNVIFGNGGQCIDLNGTQTTLVYQNDCYGNQTTRPATYNGEITLTDQGNSTSSTPNNVIENNAVQATGSTYAIYVDNIYAGKTNTYANNLLYAAQTNWYFWNATGGNNLSTFNAFSGVSGTLNADPLFANSSATQFWLRSGSPGIGAGAALGAPYNLVLIPGSTWPDRVTTNTANTPPDLGAYVYNGLGAINATVGGAATTGGAATIQ